MRFLPAIWRLNICHAYSVYEMSLHDYIPILVRRLQTVECKLGALKPIRVLKAFSHMHQNSDLEFNTNVLLPQKVSFAQVL